MCKYKIFLILFFYVSNTLASPLIFGLGAGYEEIHGLIDDQNDNVLTRISLSTERAMLNITKSSTLYAGIEIAARNGFSGALDVSDEIQNEISGPTPGAISSPEIQFLATVRTNMDRKMPYILAKVGADCSIFKFDRADLTSAIINNILGFVGLGFKLTQTSDVQIFATRSMPLTKLHFSESYVVNNPYTEKAFFVEFVRAF